MLLFIFLADPGVDYFSGAYFGQGYGSILLDNVACNGNETSLISCSYTTPTSSDSHSEDAGVRCPGQKHFFYSYNCMCKMILGHYLIYSLIHSLMNKHFHLKVCHFLPRFFVKTL